MPIFDEKLALPVAMNLESKVCTLFEMVGSTKPCTAKLHFSAVSIAGDEILQVL